MEFSGFINNIAQLAGITEGSEERNALNEALKNEALAKAQISDSFSQKVVSSLMNTEGAMNNAQIKNKFFAEFSNGIDADLQNIWRETGLPEDVIASLKKEDKTSKRLRETAKALKEQGMKLGDPNQKTQHQLEIAAAQKQLGEYEKQLAAATDKAKANDEAWQAKMSEMERSFAIRSGLANYVPKMLDSYDESIRMPLLEMTINEVAKDLGFRLVVSDGKILVKQSADVTLDFIHEGKKQTFDSIVNLVLTQKNLIKKSGGNEPAKTQPFGNGMPQNGNAQTNAWAESMRKLGHNV